MAWSLEINSISYPEYLELKDILHNARRSGSIKDTWLFTSHAPGIFTYGRSFHESSLVFEESRIRSHGWELHEIDRGGDITYHGPSQLMLYPFIEVPNKDIEELVRNLEQIVINLLAEYHLAGTRNPGFPGVWCNGGKIASIGLAVRKWITYHGMAFNQMRDDGGFGMIIPCGIKGVVMTSLEEELGQKVNRTEIIQLMREYIEEIFNCELSGIEIEQLKEKIEYHD